MLAAAAATLRRAGVERPEAEARLLLAHAADLDPGRLLPGTPIDPATTDRFHRLLAARKRRIPLQHLTGVAHFRYLELSVGPGVFVPRPETEVMTGWAIERLRERPATQPPLVVDLCTGSGAVAKAIATELPGARVHAVEISPEAARWAAHNLTGTGVALHVGDMADCLGTLDGEVDLVIANPPYIPLDAYESVAVEARDHDPVQALFAGADGLDAIRVVVRVAARLLTGGGVLCFEHAEPQAESAPAVVLAGEAFEAVRDRRDLTGRPRFVTARRRPR